MVENVRIIMFTVLFFVCGTLGLEADYYSEYAVIPVGSSIYTTVGELFQEAGQQNFTRDLPVTVKELRSALTRINRSRLSKESRRVLDELTDYLVITEPGEFPLKLSITATAEGYGNWNSDYTEWVDNTTRTYTSTVGTVNSVTVGDKVYESADGNREYGFKDRHTPVEIDLEAPFTEFLYGRVDGSIGKGPFQVGVPQDNYTNIPTAGDQIDLMAPYRAFISGGSGSLTLQLGRDRLSWGNGVSGNMIVSDNPLYYDFFKLSWFQEKFKYSFVTIGLETWLLDRDFIYRPDGSLRDPSVDNATNKQEIELAKAYYNQSKVFLGHRLEFYPFQNLYIALSENTIYGGKPLSLNYINPFMIYHSYYVQGYGNSFLTLEASYSPVHSVNIYGQIGVDQFQTPMEVANGWGGDEEPGAMGYIAGISYHPRILNKPFTFGYEWAYTSAYLYYGNNYDHDDPWGGNSPVLAISSRRRVNSLTSPIKVNSYIDQSMGYYTGPDSVVHFFYADFPRIAQNLTSGIELTWLQKGERHMYTQFYVPVGRGSAAGPTGTVEHKVITELWLAKDISEDISAGGQADLIFYRNLNHIDGNDGMDIQFGIYCSWKIM